MRLLSLALALALLLTAGIGNRASAQDDAVAITGARIITVTKGEIASGTIVVRGGKIAELGESVQVPTGARTIDGKGLVAFPGMVHPHTRIAAKPRAAGDGATGAQILAWDELSPAAEILAAIPRTGFTTLVMPPTGGTITGQSVAFKPVGVTRDEMVVARAACLVIHMEATTQAKDELRRELEAAKKAMEPAKKPAAGAAAPAAKPAAPPAKPEERTEVMIRHLKAELPALVVLSSAAELLHFRQVAKPFDEHKTRTSYVLPSEAYKAASVLESVKPRVVMRPELAFLPYTRTRVNAAAEVARAGATVAFVPQSDSLPAWDSFLHNVAEAVKHGFERDAALRAVTIVPAEIAGVEARVGSLEAGKDADILLFDGDPLSSTARLVKVIINGKVAWEP